MKQKLRVGVLGATGMVGQRYVSLLANHPFFEVTCVAASPKSAGQSYREAVANRWRMEARLDEAIGQLPVLDASDVEAVAKEVDFVFSAVNMAKEDVQKLELDYAKHDIPVISNNSAHRWTNDVPMIIPEINPQHAKIIDCQRKHLHVKKGFIAVKPNCSIQSYTPALAAWQQFEPTQVVATTYQAISGAGKTFKEWPEMQGNIIPYIAGEEEKSETEPLKILGYLDEKEQSIKPATSPLITTQCLRVPVLYGHTAACFINFKQKPTKEALVEALINYQGPVDLTDLPSAPKHFIQYLTEDDRPQVRLDVAYEKGMGVSIGRLRPDKLFDWKFIGLSHNTARGAAGGAIECAELLVKLGYLTK